MNLYPFLNFNDHCPVCGNQLTLYLSISKHGILIPQELWKSALISPAAYQFHYLKRLNFDGKKDYSQDNYITMYDSIAFRETQLVFHDYMLEKESRAWQFFFFKACNANVIEQDKDNSISWYDACYHRSSPWYEFKPDRQDRDKWVIDTMVPEHQDLINREECFAFKKLDKLGMEKVYLLSLDVENQKTKFHFYQTTAEERNQKDFEPNYFDKEDLPLMKCSSRFEHGKSR